MENYPIYLNYLQGKLPTRKEWNEYNKIKHTDYSMVSSKNKTVEIAEYEESKGNPDYYVKPGRIDFYLK
ncbi:hypothetical protein EII29_05365 [Leptotrichia sp. OH3620_COT-345]|uniref:hypothetical protein n=1 Tax=Leptotrichia sp. OH3620_COT-345 TaxID=2491048 RepID=UPI000F646E1A|nr:hypothetical protein [Leptotrichia sp. OH3620_COT-345]RRD39950.1 hypothetical protein EII29_05365 [Leptotrichia sp. OH3620_COT-345]